MPYVIYGKRIKEYKDEKGYTHSEDKRFSALDYAGCRVTNLADAGTYATREDAEEKLEKVCDPKLSEFVKFEIRKVK